MHVTNMDVLSSLRGGGFFVLPNRSNLLFISRTKYTVQTILVDTMIRLYIILFEEEITEGISFIAVQFMVTWVTLVLNGNCTL